jgi:hypothetical protein
LRHGLAWVRGKKTRSIWLLTAVVAVLLLALIESDVIRLGPSTFTVTDELFHPSVVVYHETDTDPSYDYYSLAIHIPGGLTKEPSIKPWAADVSVRLGEAELLGTYVPKTGDNGQRTTTSISLTWTMSCDTPAGQVTIREDRGYFNWTVRGERGLRGQPIYEDYVVFCLSMLRVPQDAIFAPEITVTLAWFYSNPLQAYPVATKTMAAEIFTYP